ncbi:hypothetical protein CCACVL1_29681 [Corchorus capsularis]|uniref:Uncharacterized protein n=1 Tax=Corchorus capsularis TaxID=210143 RepID=A0A1R3G0T3_COCAP|nr:hypothetical protein CCACVL1_29681 [Corchorus capsularis]
MAFGKRNSQANFSPIENLEDDDTMVPEYENYSNSDDDSIEDLEALDTNTKATGQIVRESNVTNQSNKPLLDEVIMRGVPENSKLTDRGPKAKGLIADAFHNMDRHQVDKEIVTALCANEDALIDDSHVRLEEMRWPSLDDDGEETFGHEDMQQEEDTLNARIGSDSGNKKRMSSSASGSGTSSSQPRKRKQSNISTFMRQGSSSSKRI